MRKVTEDDFRIPEYRGQNVDDYEFRDDGKIVRKDRFEVGMREIAYIGCGGREYEIPDIIERVRNMFEHFSRQSSDEYEDSLQ